MEEERVCVQGVVDAEKQKKLDLDDDWKVVELRWQVEDAARKASRNEWVTEWWKKWAQACEEGAK